MEAEPRPFGIPLAFRRGMSLDERGSAQAGCFGVSTGLEIGSHVVDAVCIQQSGADHLRHERDH